MSDELNYKRVFSASGDALKELWNEWQGLPYRDEYGEMVYPSKSSQIHAVNWADVKQEFRSLSAKEIKSYHLLEYIEPVMFFYGKDFKQHRVIDKLEDDDTFTGDMSAIIAKLKEVSLVEFKPQPRKTIGDLIYAEWQRMEETGRASDVQKVQESMGIEAKTFTYAGKVVSVRFIEEKK